MAGSDWPPIQIGMCGGSGRMRMSVISASMYFVGKVTGSCVQTARIMAMPSSIRRPRSLNGTPSALNSASIQPTPAPRIRRPSESSCSVASSLASGIGWRIGSTSTVVPSRTRLVQAAAQVRESTGS